MASTTNTSSVNVAAHQLKSLHVPGNPIVLTNVWDIPSFHAVTSLNTTASRPVKAIATASFAIAATLGIQDEDLTLEQNLSSIATLSPLCAQANLPLTVDLQDGYGADLQSAVTRAVQLGACGANIEDSIPSAGFAQGVRGSLYPLEEQVDRLRHALRIAEAAGCPDFVLNARCDVFRLVANPDRPELDAELTDEARMTEAIKRGKAFLDAGATTVFMWGGGGRGLRTEEVERLVRELGGRVSVKIADSPGALSVDELASIGVARVSLGPGLWTLAQDAVIEAAGRLLAGGALRA